MNYTWISQNNELRIYFDSFYNGKIRLSGKINRVVQKGLIQQFEQSLSKTFISVS